MKAAQRTRLCVLGFILMAGCNGVPAGLNVTFPGLALNGGNNPPIFISQSLELTAPQELTLSATAIDPDGDGLTITYLQTSGPDAIEESSVRLGGILTVKFFI